LSDLKKYIANRKRKDPVFAEGYESGYNDFKNRRTPSAGARGIRANPGRNSSNSANAKIGRYLEIENHAERYPAYPLWKKFAASVGRKLEVKLS